MLSDRERRRRGTNRASAHPARKRAPGRLLIGRSVEGRRIDAVELGDPNSSENLLVVEGIHGNEWAELIRARVPTTGRVRRPA